MCGGSVGRQPGMWSQNAVMFEDDPFALRFRHGDIGAGLDAGRVRCIQDGVCDEVQHSGDPAFSRIAHGEVRHAGNVVIVRHTAFCFQTCATKPLLKNLAAGDVAGHGGG